MHLHDRKTLEKFYQPGDMVLVERWKRGGGVPNTPSFPVGNWDIKVPYEEVEKTIDEWEYNDGYHHACVGRPITEE